MKKTQFAYITIVIVFLMAAFLWYKYKMPKFGIGKKVPDITVELRDGSRLSFSELRGKYVLLHFWGSWCGPCRREIPELIALYNQFGGQKLEILSIGIEQRRESWEQGIEKLGMTWRLHTSEVQMFEAPIAKKFGVWQIPTTWLVNPDGVVVGWNLSAQKIEQILEKK